MPSPAKQVDPRDLFITRNPTGLTSDELEKGRSGFVDHRTHGDYLVFLSGYEAATDLDPSDEGQGQHALIEAEGCKPEISIRPVTSAAAGPVAHDLNKAEGEQPDLSILHVAAPCAATAVGRCQKAEGGQPCVTEAESNKQAMLAFAATLGEICQALGIDGHSEPDMIVDAALEMSTASTSLNLQLAELASLLEHWLQLGDASDSNLTDLMKETSALLDQDPPIWQRAAMDVLLERRRQIAKGYTADHDDQYGTNELAAYGVVHALLATGTDPDWEHLSAICLWEVEPGEPRTLLVKAIALLLAALESLDRCAERAQTDTELVRLRQLALEVQRES